MEISVFFSRPKPLAETDSELGNTVPNDRSNTKSNYSKWSSTEKR